MSCLSLTPTGGHGSHDHKSPSLNLVRGSRLTTKYIFLCLIACVNNILFFVPLDSQHIPTTPAANRNKRKMQQIYAN